MTISNQGIPVSAITISGGTSITTRGGTLQLSATVQPANATNKTVSWSITSGSSFAGINAATGLLTAVADGVVTVRATATDGSGVYGSHSVTIANQKVLVKAITIIISKGSPLITVDDGSITLSASISPSNASNKSIAWSVINETGMATIDQAGRLVAIANGTVRVKATALDGSNVSGTLTITITNQINRVQTITIHSVNGNFQITDENRTLQLEAVLLPEYATNQEIIWSINNLSGHASIDNTGLVTGISSGIVSVKALAADGSGVFDEFEINIQFKPTESLKIIVDENELKVPLDEACPDCRISLYSLSGYLLNSKPVESDLMIFERAGLRPGMFFIILDNQHGIIRTGKVIIGK
ncbi:MAG TPA: Ig-like domain-containing protein [Bacteroidales bacterium]|nr:Ig-like domain-containing protein [Bacteroidales bacterium]